MIEPLRLSFEVACSQQHAFEVWTSDIGRWWPPDHTVTGKAEFIVLQSGVGGRIYELAADGVEHDWGEVTDWDPPHKLSYLWHLGRERRDATEVGIRFVAKGESATRIDIEHRGWERLGTAAGEWRDRNRAGWESLMTHFVEAAGKGGAT